MKGREDFAINLRQLQYFRKVVEVGNITGAAKAHNIAQPALGAQIRELEQELGVELLKRHSRGVAPTAAGKLLYRHAQRILDAVELARQDVQTLEARRKQQLRLGVSPSMVIVLGPNIFTDASREIPDISISLQEDRTPSLLDALKCNKIDVAFVHNVHDHPDLDRKALVEEDLLLITAPSRGAKGDAVSLTDAVQHDIVLGGDSSGIRRTVEREAQRLSLELKLAYEVHSLASLKAVVARGAACTIMPYSFVAKEFQEGTLTGRRIMRPALTRTLYIVRPRPHTTSLDDERVGAYIQKLIDTYVGAIAPWGRTLA